jgi:uncharacterized protein YodC (DUF2158 family)
MMSTEKIELELRAANPIRRRALAALDLTAGEEALGRALIDQPALAGEPDLARPSRPGARRPRRALLALATLAAVVVAVVALLVGGGGGAGSPTPAYGADLVRFAESSPLLLLEAPGWKVENVDQPNAGEGMMGFTRDGGGPVDQRWVELTWNPVALAKKLLTIHFDPPLDRTPSPEVTTRIASLGATVHIDTRSESAPRYGHPGDHEMTAIWMEGSHVLTLDTRVPSLAAFRERLEAMHRVDAQTWLGAMPAKVVKAAAYGGTVDQILKGIPLPPGFDPNSIPRQGLTADRYQVGAEVGGTVACAWFSRWGEARAGHDTAGAEEAEKVLLESEKRWPIFREMAKEGGYPATVTEYAEAMPSGRWFGRPLLEAVDSNGGLCGPEDAGGGGR